MPTPVSCDWYAGNNCWKTAVAEANACIDEREQGTLDGDGRGCSYPGAVRLSFAASVLDADDGYVWSFSVARGGEACVAFTQLGPAGEGGFSIATRAGELRQRVVDGDLIYGCPSGEGASIGAEESLDCEAGLPAILYDASATAATFAFLGGATNEVLFDCRLP